MRWIPADKTGGKHVLKERERWGTWQSQDGSFLSMESSTDREKMAKNKFSFGIFQRNQQYCIWREKQRTGHALGFWGANPGHLKVTVNVRFLRLKIKVLKEVEGGWAKRRVNESVVVNVTGDTFQYLPKVSCRVKASAGEGNTGTIQAQGPAVWAT